MSARPSRLFFIKLLGFWGVSDTSQKNSSPSKLNSHVQDDNKDAIKNNETVHDLSIGYSDVSQPVKNSSRKIVNFMLEKGAPGLTVCVSQRGQVVWKAAFGFCDAENHLICDPDAHMRIASISKPLFSTAIIGPMIEQKKIDLNSSIYKYLSYDEFPKQKYQDKEFDISVIQLLSHTSGIKHYVEYQPEKFTLKPIGSNGSKKVYQCDDQYNKIGFYQRRTYRNVFEALEPFMAGPLVKEPGNFNYTTYGYTLLSAVAQKIHQAQDDKQKTEQIEDFWLKVLRRDWGMKNTFLDQDEVFIPKRARYYLRTSPNGGLINAPYADSSIKWAGGGINSTTEDLIKFANNLIDCYKEKDGAKLKKSTVDVLLSEVSNSYALGYYVERLKTTDNKEKLVIYHTGGALGASSMLLIYPESEVVVALLTNLGSVGMKDLSIYIADEFEKQ